MKTNRNEKYIEFAANIHFFEFLQEEFNSPHFKLDEYFDEIKELDKKTNWDQSSLSKFLRNHPKSFEIFQEIFQLRRFTNTQLTHFLFDVELLNRANQNKIKEYLIKNLERDVLFFDIYGKGLKNNDNEISPQEIVPTIKNNKDDLQYFIWIFKDVVVKYVSASTKKREVLWQRLENKEFKEVSERVSKYLIENLKLNDVLKGLNVKNFLMGKRVGKDTKGIHGKFGHIKINQILEKHGVVNVDKIFKKIGVKEIGDDLCHAQLEPYSNKVVFVTEKYISGIKKRKDNKLKKFDFIVLNNLKPKILIETNFYSTAGTKIGINEGEYIDLNEDIKSGSNRFLFLWITDGNYWLTKNGRSRLINLYRYFGDCILNYNLFDKKLPLLIKDIKNEN